MHTDERDTRKVKRSQTETVVLLLDRAKTLQESRTTEDGFNLWEEKYVTPLSLSWLCVRARVSAFESQWHKKTGRSKSPGIRHTRAYECYNHQVSSHEGGLKKWKWKYSLFFFSDEKQQVVLDLRLGFEASAGRPEKNAFNIKFLKTIQ